MHNIVSGLYYIHSTSYGEFWATQEGLLKINEYLLPTDKPLQPNWISFDLR